MKAAVSWVSARQRPLGRKAEGLFEVRNPAKGIPGRIKYCSYLFGVESCQADRLTCVMSVILPRTYGFRSTHACDVTAEPNARDFRIRLLTFDPVC